MSRHKSLLIARSIEIFDDARKTRHENVHEHFGLGRQILAFEVVGALLCDSELYVMDEVLLLVKLDVPRNTIHDAISF